jgi:YegS/Rv2252/BmrU family lipid kinase
MFGADSVRRDPEKGNRIEAPHRYGGLGRGPDDSENLCAASRKQEPEIQKERRTQQDEQQERRGGKKGLGNRSHATKLRGLPRFESVKNLLVILNPAAHSEKAGRLADRIREVAGDAEIRLSSMPGDAERIASEAAAEGYGSIVAAGGDGTVNEVVNGIVASGRGDVTLGILPVGTMNVFAVELGIPLNSLRKAWDVVLAGHSRQIDLPQCVTGDSKRGFVQLAGVGLDAEVVRRTSRESKNALGPLSYLLSLAQIVGEKPPLVTLLDGEGRERSGSFVLLGNGRYYGGPFRVFRRGVPDDGLLDVLVFRNQSPWDLLRYLHAIAMGQHADLPDVEYFQTLSLEVRSEGQVPFELDGEMAGFLPVSFSVLREGLRVFTPPASA